MTVLVLVIVFVLNGFVTTFVVVLLRIEVIVFVVPFVCVVVLETVEVARTVCVTLMVFV